MATPKKVPAPNTPAAPPAQAATATAAAKTPIKPELIPENTTADVTTTIKYNVAQNAQGKAQQQNRQFQQPIKTAVLSENPLLEFLEQADDEPDCYVLLTRLPDAISGVKYARPCAAAETFSLFPLNKGSFVNDVQQMNGNSGGRFKALIVDENMNDLGFEPLKGFNVPNPLNVNNNNAPETQETTMLKFMQDSEKRFTELVTKMNEPKESDIDKLMKTVMLEQLGRQLRGEATANGANPLATLPPETQAMLALVQNPIVTKTVAQRMSDSLNALFESPEKTEETAKAALTWADRITTLVVENPEIQNNLMTLAGKVIGLVGFGVSKFGGKSDGQRKPRPQRPNPNAQNTPPQQPPVSNPAPPEQETNFVDVEFTEVTEATEFELTPEEEAQEQAIREHPLFIEVLRTIDGGEPLTLEMPVFKTGAELGGLKFKLALATFKEQDFDTVLNSIYDLLPMVEDYTTDEIMITETETIGQYRLKRLMEFHALLKDYNG